MIVSFESGCDWTDAGYALMETDLTEAELDAKREEWQKLYREANQKEREVCDAEWKEVKAQDLPYASLLGKPPGHVRCDGYTVVGDFSTWLEKQGLVRSVEYLTYSDMD